MKLVLIFFLSKRLVLIWRLSDVLNCIDKQNILLFISGVDISIDEISILEPIYDAIRKEEQYKIVWIPIVDQWNDDMRKKFEMLKSKMPWYVVQYISPIAGIKFIKEEWHFKNKPIIVVMNPKGKVECPYAIHMIRVWGMRAFPFSSSVEEDLSNGRDWMGSTMTGINPNLHNWVKSKRRCTFSSMVARTEWIQQFTKSANVLANDPVIKDARVSMELLCVGKSNKGEDDHSILGHFWNRIDSFFFSKTQRESEPDPVAHEIQKLLSYKNESGWAVLSKGSRVVVLEKFEKWKEHVRQIGFEVCFKEYHDKLLHTTRRCCRVNILITTGKIPEHMKCPECPRVMEAYKEMFMLVRGEVGARVLALLLGLGFVSSSLSSSSSLESAPKEILPHSPHTPSSHLPSSTSNSNPNPNLIQYKP
ncbi:protein sieve element occlusion b [Quercus suber]|uniref:Protein sieve element occlusion b n=1 Tax=Quercus suber TaxID=58331 RepID=A0AAW0M7U9_QUESU